MGAWWEANWGNIVGAFGTVVGVAGFYVAWVCWRVKRIFYAVHEYALISADKHAIPELQISFAGYGEPIHSLTVTRLAVWNSGTETINKSDVVKDYPLCVEVADGCVILAASIVQHNNEASKISCTLSRDRKRVTVQFDYLDGSHGAVLQIIHTGTTPTALVVKGVVKGIKGPQKRDYGQLGLRRMIPFHLVWGLVLVTGTTGLLFSPKATSDPFLRAFFWVALISWLTLFGFLLCLVLLRDVAQNVPRSLDQIGNLPKP